MYKSERRALLLLLLLGDIRTSGDYLYWMVAFVQSKSLVVVVVGVQPIE